MDTRGLPLRATFTLSAALTASLLLGSGCNPYERRYGEYNAGAVDPVNFPAIYLGAGGNAKRPGLGVFQFVSAYVRGQEVSFYPLPFTGNIDLNKISSIPLSYVFDPDKVGVAHDSDKCVKAEGYTYDRQADAVRLDRQGNIFTKLPATGYVPIVKEVVVNSVSNPCQDSKSEENLVNRTDVSVSLNPPPENVLDGRPSGRPSGKFLLWAIIDPAADVVPVSEKMLDPVTRLGPQRWGWYQRYLLAYLDGGYIPIDLASPMGQQRMATQRIYVPTLVYDAAEKMPVDNDAPGSGLDIMEFRRGEDGYSPVCRIFTFDPADPMKPEKTIAEIDRTTIKDTGTHVYCIQTP